jgi:hypothetical protein
MENANNNGNNDNNDVAMAGKTAMDKDKRPTKPLRTTKQARTTKLPRTTKPPKTTKPSRTTKPQRTRITLETTMRALTIPNQHQTRNLSLSLSRLNEISQRLEAISQSFIPELRLHVPHLLPESRYPITLPKPESINWLFIGDGQTMNNIHRSIWRQQ